MVGDTLACIGVDSVKDVSGQIAFEATRNAVGHIKRESLEHLEDTLYTLTRDHPHRAVIIASTIRSCGRAWHLPVPGSP